MPKERIPAIIGVDSAFPPNIIDNAQIDQNLGKKTGLTARVMRVTGAGIKERHWVTPGEQTSSDLSIKALLGAIEMARIDKNDIKAIIVGTTSGDYVGVATAALIQHNLGLSPYTRGYDVSAACTGWAQSLQNAFDSLMNPYSDGGPIAVIGAEVLSPVLSTKQDNVYPLFGDGAGATIIDLVEPDEGAPTKMAIKFGVDGAFAENLYMPAGGSKHPTTIETVKNDMNTLHMDGAIIKDQAIPRMAEVTKKALEATGIPVEEIDLFIPHQANLSIMHGVADALNVPWEKVFVTIDRYGNTSAASIPTALKDAFAQERIRRNQILGFATFGAGLTFAGGILPMVGLPK